MAEVVAETPVVVMVNVADVAPAGTKTDAGGTALALFELRLTDVPPGPAAPFKVTVPVEDAPPITDDGDTETLARPAGITVKVADCELAP